jgi:DNA-directed RNA polymerase subunit RPC12/RpoP
MHVSDAGDGGEGKPICVMRCSRCGAETEWLEFENVTEAKRGIPCEACNVRAERPQTAAPQPE